jgi:hypothetical protein
MSNIFQINRRTRDAFILNLRRIFANDPKYPYIETQTGEYDFDRTKIVISDAIPQEHAFFPCLIVDTVSGSEDRYLGPDDLSETKDNSHQTVSDKLFASINLTVNIRLYTIDDTIARDEIIDRIYDHFKITTDDLADNSIEIKRTTFIPDTRSFQNDRWLVTTGLSLEVYTEWVDELGVTDRVAKIPIDVQLNLEP